MKLMSTRKHDVKIQLLQFPDHFRILEMVRFFCLGKYAWQQIDQSHY
ncbi:hypothetical protein Enr10x_15790 [Gimesia panareensis]|uniref:Uncharacterized protein n=1 Tax=Gimesia panareensis TaxID=2527978 RepID=A0A517Q3U2_9PLAN|nr:hypothetical protein Enr10x_15790 [Gimesia panareensis]